MFKQQIGRLSLLVAGLLSTSAGVIAQTPQANRTAPQSSQVSGKVTDPENQPLAGVAVTEKGTTNGTLSGAAGTFSLSVSSPAARLVFSFSGFRQHEVTVQPGLAVNIQMQVNTQVLSELIVTGYTSQNKRDITGAVASVSGRDLESVPGNNFVQQLQGRVAGVSIGNDGSPGADITVRIRGIGSITGNNDPLYIIDGVPTTENLNALNPNDIESLQVLKDAASASVYGARANNGVIIITTKKGKPGKSQLTVDAYYGLQKLTNRLPKYLNLAQYENLSTVIDPIFGLNPDLFFGDLGHFTVPDYVVAPGIGVKAGDPRANPSAYDLTKNPITKANTAGGDYWFRQLYRTAPTQNYTVGLTGGSENGRYALSLGYQDQQGILRFTGFKRYSLRVNTDFLVGRIFHIGENVSGTFTDRVATFRNDDNSPLAQVNTQFFQPVYDIKGNFASYNQGNFYINPYSTLYYAKDQHDYNARLFGNTYLEAQPVKGLTARTSFGVDLTGDNFSKFVPTQFSQRTAQPAILDVNNSYTYNTVWTNTLNYALTVGRHKINVIGGTEAVTINRNVYDAQKTGFPFESLPFQYFDAASQVVSASGSPLRSSLFSLFAKADYQYNDKYIASATIRRDASSRFGPLNRYGFFPAFSAGWRISKEEFLRNVSFLEDLKIRASWGRTGNQNIDENNQYTTYAQRQAFNYDFTGSSNSTSGVGLANVRQGNSSTHWESQTMTNLGLDVSLFSGQLTANLDLYSRHTTGLLLKVPHAATEGEISTDLQNISSVNYGQVNAGAVRNRGLELQIGYNSRPVERAFRYGISGNISFDRNKVLALYSGLNSFIPGVNGEPTRTLVGHPISSFYGYVIDGFFQTQAEADAAPTQGGNRSIYNQPGRWKFRDINHDGVIDDKDQTIIGNPLPKFTYGLNFTASWGPLDATLFLQGVYGNDLFNAQLLNTDFLSVASYPSSNLTNSWSPQNRHAVLPAINPNADGLERQPSTYEVEKGSYLRIKNAQFGYTLPAERAKHLGFSRVHFYLQGSNLLTITKYKGIDPEVGVRYTGNGSDITTGVDRGIYPLAHTFLIGLQLGL